MRPTKSDHVSDADLARLGLSRETDLVLDPEGNFFSGDQPVAHAGIAAGFARWIERTDAGRYVLRNDLHYVYLDVQGAPLHARGARIGTEGAILELSGGDEEPLRPETLRRDSAGVLYASGRDGSWPIRLRPRAVLELESLLSEDSAGEPVFVVGGVEHSIRLVEDPLDGSQERK
ncbi:MAG: hypothetical protein JKY65_13265 [Planctomycetes bacterium]|nr:hypothetical protein [Planctomycetota bacterium]